MAPDQLRGTVRLPGHHRRTDGELLRIDSYLESGVKHLLHSHLKREERFIVREGRLGLTVADEELIPESGDEATVSIGPPHTFWNAGSWEGHLTTEHRPALRFEPFLRAMVAPDRENELDFEGMPANPLVGATVTIPVSVPAAQPSNPRNSPGS